MLPDDYEEMVRTHGASSFFHGLRWPVTDVFVALVGDYAEVIRGLRSDGIESLASEPMFPEPGCLVRWADSNGYFFLWRNVGPPAEWATFGGEGTDDDPWPGSETESVLAFVLGGTDRFNTCPPESDPPDSWHTGRPVHTWFEPDWPRRAQLMAPVDQGERPFVEWSRSGRGALRRDRPAPIGRSTDQKYGMAHFEANGCRVKVFRRAGSIELILRVEQDAGRRLDHPLEAVVRRVGQSPSSSSAFTWDHSTP